MILTILFVSCSTNQVEINKEEIKENIVIEEKIILEPTEENFLMVLNTNQDGREYLEKHPQTKILNITKFHPKNINITNQEFKDLYFDLPQKELYRVDFIAEDTQLSLMTVIDLENKETIKIFGLFIMGMST